MTTPHTDTSREERFFIRKNGVYYRPNSRGYTTSAISAGLYTQEEAEKITYPNGPDGPRDGMSYIAEHICPDEDWHAYRALLSERDALRGQLAAARNEALEEAAKVADPKGEEPSVDGSNPGDIEEHSGWLTEKYIAEAIRALKSTTPAPRHTDDVAVDRFAEVMKAKLAAKRSDGRGGWDDKELCSQAFLSDLLRGHVDKGDPVDVANFAMMLQQRGEAILPAPREVTVQEAARKLWEEYLRVDSWPLQTSEGAHGAKCAIRCVAVKFGIYPQFCAQENGDE